jgi:hypothetical protein
MDLPGSPEEYYANVNTTFTMTKIALYASTTLLSDILLVKLSVYCSSMRSNGVVTGV